MHVHTGDMPAAIRALAWDDTPLGPMAAWPQALRSALDTILPAAFPMFIVWGPERRMLYNDAYIPILADRHPGALGRPFAEVWGEVWHDIEPLIASAMRGQTVYCEDLEVELVRHGQRAKAWFTFSYSGLHGDDGAWAGALCVCHETTSAVLGERINRSHTEMLRQLFDEAPGFIAVLRGPDHVFELENAAHRAFHHGRALTGKSVAEALPELAGQGIIELLDQVRATGVPYSGRGVRLDTMHGDLREERYIDFVFQPLLDEFNRPQGIFVTGHEVTEQVLARQALLQAARQKDQFIATLAHELRNPLAPILTAARLLDAPDLPRERIAASTGVITRQVQQMAHLLDDLLDVARITRGSVRLQKKHANADELVALAVETTDPLLRARGHRLRVAHRDGALELEADPVRIVQVVANLLSNAAKYTEHGGEISVETRLDDGDCVITVSDNGIGLRPEALEKVFGMFSQEQHALDRSEGGLGIGLALVKGLVELHGGSVRAQSPGPGHGSVFTVRLPGARRAGFELRPQEATREIRMPRRRILLADDNRDLLDMLSQFLELQGHDVLKASDGEEALELARQGRPDVAILDIGMPRLNGYQLAQAIRREPWGAEVLLVAATGWGQDDDKGKAMSSGFNTHITKPFGLDTLEQLLR